MKKKWLKKERINFQKGNGKNGTLTTMRGASKGNKRIGMLFPIPLHDNLKSGFPGANLIQILNPPQWHK